VDRRSGHGPRGDRAAPHTERLPAPHDFLLRAGGHIGYGIRPSARGRGLATWALGQVLSKATALGLDRVLITCADGNVASARVIERRGGVLEDVRDTELGRTRRYWVTLADQSPL
jgi:predicted acetyltransferase